MANSGPAHSLGPTCAYYEEPSDAAGDLNQVPKAKAQFFYVSALPIDDPLSALPPIQSDPKTSQHPPQPFAARDNAALEEAWQGFQKEDEIERSPGRRHGEKFRFFPKFKGADSPNSDLETLQHSQQHTPVLSQDENNSISGRPFARAPTYRKHPLARTRSDTPPSPSRSRLHSPVRTQGKPEDTHNQALVPVGLSRLHLVELPAMLMKPIYWNPVNDISTVTRGTWFYLDSMLPVEQDVATQLELGFLDMKPWTDVWQEELQAIVKSGDADAELKVIHKLWPTSRPTTTQTLDVATGGQNTPVIPQLPDTSGHYRNSSVVYLNSKDAQILRPSLLPSVSRSRRPLGAIRKGRPIGVPVVRGFDRAAYDKIHGRSPDQNKKTIPSTTKAAQAKVGAYMNQSGDATTTGRHAVCPACSLEEATRPKVTDLVLVIHGIGQKLSERVDSYHFTHAINSFRREVNVEMADQATRGFLHQDLEGGMMVLPINWRLMVDFDDKSASPTDSHENDFQLSDITPDSLPAVRGLISDVMLDIPYYLSHHKEKMTSAVIKEANRVFRLWCQNNPGFEENGRVHLIAHSLGSVMALDILSQQPTKVSGSTSKAEKVNDKTFEFNTSTLFTCGSPSGFFLLLNKANLLPRKGLNKPGMEGEDKGRGIAGEAGTYGCLAVNNLFNIAHRNDPVAYMQNACVDAEYARSLVPAYIPSATSGFFKKIGNAVWWGSSSAPSAAIYQSKALLQRPTVKQLPSTVELETHDFSREEIAEKRMFLLNDYGQIDFLLAPGGIQYLDMLGAHSSYWISQDFVRFLVMEIGREQGKEATLAVLRAQKRREWKKGSIV